MNATRHALDALLGSLSAALAPAHVAVAGAASEGADVVLTPVALRRVGRSRRDGALLDLELTVVAAATGADALDHLEAVLVLAETSGLSVGPPPEPPVLGLTLTLPVSLRLDEPTAPLVKTMTVELHTLTTLTGRVVQADGSGAGGAAVSSSLTRQVVTTDPLGAFQLLGVGRATSVTASKGPLTATVDVPADAATVSIALPSPPEGS